MAYEIFKTCETCGGDGIAYTGGYPSNPVTCWRCAGVGKVRMYEIADLADHVADMLDKCSDILDKCNDIFEKVSE